MKEIFTTNIIVGTLAVYLVDSFPPGTKVWDAPLIDQKILMVVSILGIFNLNFGIK